MRILIVTAHPLVPSLTSRFADRLSADLAGRGHEMRRVDLYREGFDPVLTREERAGYYRDGFEDRAGLAEAEGLILVFPTWWFGLPAVLKGWIDRSFLPGVAFDHAPDGGAMRPRLGLRSVMVVTTMGAPRWYDWLVARRPVFRALRWGVVKPCAPRARFRQLTLYGAETLSPAVVGDFETRMLRVARGLFPQGAQT